MHSIPVNVNIYSLGFAHETLMTNHLDSLFMEVGADHSQCSVSLISNYLKLFFDTGGKYLQE